MKKILCLLLLLTIMLSQSSCDKLLDKAPFTMYEPDDIFTPTGMNLLLTGAYNLMSRRNYYGNVLILYEAAKGPDFIVRNVSGGLSYYAENRFSHSEQTNGNARLIWHQAYLAIRNLTILLENIDDVRGDPEELRRIKGQAYVLRGLCYFDLMRLFAFPPIFSVTTGSRYMDTARWGVPIVNTVEKGTNIFNYEVVRETADSTYKFILEQFKLGEQLLQGRLIPNGYANSAAAKALLIRTYLYLQDWDKVIEEGEEWLARYGSRYKMISYEDYPTTYHTRFNSESVWEFGYTTANNLSSDALNHWVRRPTWNEPGQARDGTVSDNLGYAKLPLTWGHPTRGLDFLNAFPNDIRRHLICEMGIEGFPEYFTIRKYVGDPFHFVHNIPVVRLPEIYLSIAEAYATGRNDMNAATYYTSLVSLPRRLATANVTSATHVLDERRRELILEGHTYFDYFRTARAFTNRQIIESNNQATITFGGITSPHYRAVYPIPLAEMNANPAIRDQQNPGYPKWALAIEED